MSCTRRIIVKTGDVARIVNAPGEGNESAGSIKAGDRAPIVPYKPVDVGVRVRV